MRTPHRLVLALGILATLLTSTPALAAVFVPWTPVGPGNVGGRVTGVAADPSDAGGNTIYVSSANGGVWKTTDGGASWTPLTDGQPSLATSALAVDPTAPGTLY